METRAVLLYRRGSTAGGGGVVSWGPVGVVQTIASTYRSRPTWAGLTRTSTGPRRRCAIRREISDHSAVGRVSNANSSAIPMRCSAVMTASRTPRSRATAKEMPLGAVVATMTARTSTAYRPIAARFMSNAWVTSPTQTAPIQVNRTQIRTQTRTQIPLARLNQTRISRIQTSPTPISPILGSRIPAKGKVRSVTWTAASTTARTWHASGPAPVRSAKWHRRSQTRSSTVS